MRTVDCLALGESVTASPGWAAPVAERNENFE